MRKLALLIIIAFLLGASPVMGQSSKDILPFCKDTLASREKGRDSYSFGASFCLGWVNGLLGMHKAFGGFNRNNAINMLYCPSGEVEVGQAIKILVTYFEDNQDILHLEPTLIYIKAMQEAFPCPESQSQ